MNISRFFTDLGFNDKEQLIFLTLYKLGTQPASTIAKHCSMERTGVYKILLSMVAQGIVLETIQQGVRHFFVPNADVLLAYIHRKQNVLDALEKSYDSIAQELMLYEQARYPHLPKITLYDGISGVKNLYEDIYQTTIDNKYLVIKFFASNTFESQSSVDQTLKEYSQNIFGRLKSQHITVDTYLGNGVLIMEHISKTTNIDNLNQLPAGNSAINLFVVGRALYLIIFKSIPFGIKIDNEDFANAMHFFFEKLQVE